MIISQRNTIKLAYGLHSLAQALREELKDARYFQIGFQTIILLFGYIYLHWDVNYYNLIAIYGSVTITQLICCRIWKLPFDSVKSAIISGMGLALLLRTDNPWWYVLAGTTGILSKFLLKTEKKHFFNPSNLGIMLCVLFSGESWISPGQWGNTMVLFCVASILGFIVVKKVGRLDISLAFIGTFFFLEFVRTILYQGWDLPFYLHKLSNGSLFLFTFFMITDPRSTPNHQAARIVWAASVGTLAFLLTNYQYVHGAPVWALFFLSPLTIIFDRFFKDKRFEWKTTTNKTV